MQISISGGVSLWHDVVPSPCHDAAPVLLIQGLGMQATDWPANFVAALATQRRVVLFDNRDGGLSTLFGPSADAALRAVDFPSAAPLPMPAPYTLFDMADDALRLMDRLGIERFYVVGFSMGGMIAQILAAAQPRRVLSAVGLMTSAGQPWLQSSPDADLMMRCSIQQLPDEQAVIAFMLAADDIYAGPTPLPSRATRREAIATAIRRGHHPAGIWRQAAAMRAGGDRSEMLRGIRTPLLMVHGLDDPVIAPAQAAAITIHVPQARFVELPRTGHVLTQDNAGPIADRIVAFWVDAGLI